MDRSGIACSKQAIDAGLSGYLDLVRGGAALVVVLSHLVPNLFGIDVIPGHDAVVVFFVLSGYVVCYAADQRDRSFRQFAVNRLARLWSVLLPSILVSAAAAFAVGSGSGVQFAPPIAEPIEFAANALTNALFLGQNWFVDASMPFNDPAWSMGFEAWYYAIFAAFVFTPRRWRWHAAIVGAILAGPAILALMPCWLLGAWLYHRRDRLGLPAPAAYATFAACIVLYAWFEAADVGGHARTWLSHVTANHSFRLRASTRFLSDVVIACLFSASIIAVCSMPAVNRGLAASRRGLRAISSRTFSLYLFHMPVFAILYGGFGVGRGGAGSAVLCIGLVVGVCTALGTVTEARLAEWRRAVDWSVDRTAGSVDLVMTAIGGRRRALARLDG